LSSFVKRGILVLASATRVGAAGDAKIARFTRDEKLDSE
jgi:hypothetical protein